MSIPTNIASGTLVLRNVLETACFESLEDFVKQLTVLLGVEIDASKISNVVVSNEQPSDSQTTSIWFRISNSGNFIGMYVFAGGAWRVMYPVNTDHVTQIFWFASDDGSAPPGWEKITDTTPNIAPGVIAALTAQYVQDPSNTYDIYFAAQYIGF